MGQSKRWIMQKYWHRITSAQGKRVKPQIERGSDQEKGNGEKICLKFASLEASWRIE